MAETTHPFDLLEPGVGFVALGNTGSAAEVSAAISLKRIADVLEKVTQGGHQLDPFFFDQAAYNAGTNFERGRR